MSDEPVDAAELVSRISGDLSRYGGTPRTLTRLEGRLTQVSNLGAGVMVMLRDVPGLGHNDVCSAVVERASTGLDELLIGIGKNGAITLTRSASASRDTIAPVRMHSVDAINGRSLAEIEAEAPSKEPMPAAELVRRCHAGLERYQRVVAVRTVIRGHLKDVQGTGRDTLYIVVNRVDELKPEAFCMAELARPSEAAEQKLQRIGKDGPDHADRHQQRREGRARRGADGQRRNDRRRRSAGGNATMMRRGCARTPREDNGRPVASDVAWLSERLGRHLKTLEVVLFGSGAPCTIRAPPREARRCRQRRQRRPPRRPGSRAGAGGYRSGATHSRSAAMGTVALPMPAASWMSSNQGMTTVPKRGPSTASRPKQRRSPPGARSRAALSGSLWQAVEPAAGRRARHLTTTTRSDHPQHRGRGGVDPPTASCSGVSARTTARASSTSCSSAASSRRSATGRCATRLATSTAVQAAGRAARRAGATCPGTSMSSRTVTTRSRSSCPRPPTTATTPAACAPRTRPSCRTGRRSPWPARQWSRRSCRWSASAPPPPRRATASAYRDAVRGDIDRRPRRLRGRERGNVSVPEVATKPEPCAPRRHDVEDGHGPDDRGRTLPETTDCSHDVGGRCTEDGPKLSNRTTATVAGPLVVAPVVPLVGLS